MEIKRSFGRDGLATVFIGETENGRVEFVESVQPPFSREEKWVLIVSSLYGCPIECRMCDAGGSYYGKLSADEIIDQIDYLIALHYPDRRIPVKKFKIQFARVGEPSLNPNVLEVLRRIPSLYEAPGLMPSLSTVAPSGCDNFFAKLLEIKNELYPDSFQLQFSLHSTDEEKRNEIIPANKWSLEKIALYGEKFHESCGRKVTLNFVLADDHLIDPKKLASIFSPKNFFIKMTPLNPTCRASLSGLKCGLNVDSQGIYKEPEVATQLKELGFDVLISVGELEENLIGSNCGQYLKAFEEHSRIGNIPMNSYRTQDYLGNSTKT